MIMGFTHRKSLLGFGDLLFELYVKRCLYSCSLLMVETSLPAKL